MLKENQELFELLKCSKELIKNKKSFFKEDPEKSKKLSQFFIRKMKLFTLFRIMNNIYQGPMIKFVGKVLPLAYSAVKFFRNF